MHLTLTRRLVMGAGATALAVAAMMPLAVTSAAADAMKIKISTPAVEADWHARMLTVFKDNLEAAAPGEFDVDAVLKIKALIRWSEAKAGALVVGCDERNLHFLDLPFYRTGTVDKKPVSQADVTIIRELIEKVQPQQIYVAGDLTDPHGTHRMCADAIFRALHQIESETDGQSASPQADIAIGDRNPPVTGGELDQYRVIDDAAVFIANGGI